MNLIGSTSSIEACPFVIDQQYSGQINEQSSYKTNENSAANNKPELKRT